MVRCSKGCPLGALAVHSMTCSSSTPLHPVVRMPLLHLWVHCGYMPEQDLQCWQ